MRDLDLWRRISTAAVTADEVRALGDRPLAGRVAWFGALAALIDRADPALRAAALHALGGATGVPGLRAIAARLDDDDEAVRAAAVDALRRSAGDARYRYAHALFHPRADVRRLALADLPIGTAEMAVYLRGDPACAELAARVPWPPGALALALDLHAAGRLAPGELVELVAGLAPGALHGMLAAEHGRSPAQIEAYLRDAARAPVRSVAPGSDALDQVVAAVAAVESEAARGPAGVAGAAGAEATGRIERSEAAGGPAGVAGATGGPAGVAGAAGGPAGVAGATGGPAGVAGAAGEAAPRGIHVPDRLLEHLIEAFGSKQRRALTPRAVVALLSQLARAPSPGLVALCVAIEPRVLEHTSFDPADAAAAAHGLIRFRWPHRPDAGCVERLLRRPVVRGDLALAAAVAGLLPGKRLATLAAVLGEAAILDALRARDHGWDAICRLPPEAPSRELGWLMQLADDLDRFVALAAIALAIFGDTRRAVFIDQLTPGQAAAVFLQFARSPAAADAARRAAVCQTIATRVTPWAIKEILTRLLDGAGPQDDAAVLAFARVVPDDVLVACVRRLHGGAAARLVALLDAPEPRPPGREPLPRGRELAVAAALADHADPAIRAWSARVRTIEPPPAAAPAISTGRSLTDAERSRIATCPDAELADARDPALGPALAAPATGLADALALRPAMPSLPACVALLGAGDPLDAVARQLERFATATPRFDAELDDACGHAWRYRDDLPPLANARLFRWERHTRALAAWVDQAGGVHAVLALADELPGRCAARTLWAGIAELVVFARYREPSWLVRQGTVALAVFAAARVDRDVGRSAARIAVALVESGRVPAVAIRSELLDRTADADAETREFLARIIRLDGMPEPPPAPSRVAPERALLEAIKASGDLAQLVAWCGDPRPAVVEEAALALVLIGEAGQLRLAELVARAAELPCPVPVLASVALWDSAAALAIARRLAAARLPPEWQFQLCLGLGDGDRALAAVRADAATWFRRADWDRLTRLVGELPAALGCADAPHHHAYQPALAILLATDDPRVPDALRRFLEIDASRPVHLRRAAARRLLERHGDPRGLPILIEELNDGDDRTGLLAALAPRDAAIVAEAVVSAALIGGHAACSESRMWHVVEQLERGGKIDAAARAAIAARVLDQASTAAARRAAAQLAVGAATADGRLTRVAEIFAWGIRRGVELTGRLFRVHMTGGEAELGHTRLHEARIFVSALPLLRGELHGQDIVEGLVLHELGHHRYHAGEPAQKLWQKAHREGLGHLLNLVADEHLERNLRALDPAYGDRLKRLAAYAFHHAAQDIRVPALLGCLRGAAARALTATPLEIAFDDQAVRLRRGAVLAELDRAGHPLARFARALRMGLGNRHADPVVATALELCAGVREAGPPVPLRAVDPTGGSAPRPAGQAVEVPSPRLAALDPTSGSAPRLAALDMQGLYDLTCRLAQLFGGATALARVFGGPEDLRPGERDTDVFGAGIDDDILQREVERILDPRRGPPGRGGRPDRLQINVAPDTAFDRITAIRRVDGDAAVHRTLAAGVARHAARLRALLDDLGLRHEPARARLTGRALDRTRLSALVTRRDPRILVARTPVRRTDLFLGTLVDCSGSMQAGNNLARAQRFAVLIAEAVRSLPGVEARFFGFTDSVIYDAGDAHDCGVSGLTVGGGNNDAGALLHAAQVALASQRRARALVMISDGLPTECSVDALRGLVTQLTRRRGIACAQVAVRKLDEECFPHCVLLDDAELDVAVARFGRMIGDLARRVLAA